VATTQAGSVVSPRIHPQHHPTWRPRHPRRPRRLEPHTRLNRHDRPNTQQAKLIQPPRRVPRGVVEPSSGRRGSPTATKTGSCGVGDLHSARHDPAPSAVAGAIPPSCMNRALRPQAQGRRVATTVNIPSSLHFYRYEYLLSTFYDLRWCHAAGPAEAGTLVERTSRWPLIPHSTAAQRLSLALAADSAGR
jgi:hypothetical protein